MKKVLLATILMVGVLAACNQKDNQTKTEENMQKLELTQEWDKVFPLSDKVNHRKVTFETQYGLTLLAVSGPFGACKEQSSGLYAMRMAERGFVALAFDPSYTGESSGEPRRTASPDINTEDFMAAVDFLSKQENVDAEKIGIIGICGWGGIALNAAAADTRMMAMAGGVVNPLPDDAPQFVKDYYDYYITPRGYHKRSGNSNDGWRVIGTQAYANSRFLYYINEIRSAVLVMHGEKAHSRYFGEAAYKYMVEGKAEGYNVVGKPNPNPENKELLIIPGASHCDLYDGGYTELVGKGEPKNLIPWDKLADFFNKNLK